VAEEVLLVEVVEASVPEAVVCQVVAEEAVPVVPAVVEPEEVPVEARVVVVEELLAVEEPREEPK